MSRCAAVVLAAGQATRYRASGGAAPTKLVAPVHGKPLVRHVVEAACRSSVCPVIVVTGHERTAVEASLKGLPVAFTHNAGFAQGLASSLRQGIGAVPPDASAALVLLGDMPLITPALIDRLAAAAEPVPEVDAVVPVADGRRGNPVVLARSLFPAVARLEGDAGARHLLQQPGIRVREIPLQDDAAAFDVDMLEDIARLQGPSSGAAAGK